MLQFELAAALAYKLFVKTISENTIKNFIADNTNRSDKDIEKR